MPSWTIIPCESRSRIRHEAPARDELIVLAAAIAVLGKVPVFFHAPMLEVGYGLVVAFTWTLTRTRIAQTPDVGGIVAGSEPFTSRSSSLCWQKWIQPGSLMPVRCFVGTGSNGEGRAAGVWACDRLMIKIARICNVRPSQLLKKGRSLGRPQRGSRTIPLVALSRFCWSNLTR